MSTAAVLAAPTPIRVSCPFPQEEDDDFFYSHHEEAVVVLAAAAPVLHRPSARRPVQIAVTEVKAMYEAAQELDIPDSYLEDAVLDTQEWHDRFSCYLDDTPPQRPGNPCPEEDVYEDDEEYFPFVEQEEETFAVSEVVTHTSASHCKRVRFQDQHADEEMEQVVPKEVAVVVRPSASRIVSACIERPIQSSLQVARDGLLQSLSSTRGDTDNLDFVRNLDILQSLYCADARLTDQNHGVWLTLTKPVFTDCLGENANGESLYTVGRMSFDMFSPSDLVCSLQGNFNRIRTAINVHPALQDQINVSTYDVLTAFTVEAAENPAYSTHKVRGILSTEGHVVPDPNVPNRHSIWISSGKMEANESEEDAAHWKSTFGKSTKSMKCQAMQLASKWLLGAAVECDDRSQSYQFTKPLGGHGRAWIDTLYQDESLRVVRGHKGSIFVFSKVCQ